MIHILIGNLWFTNYELLVIISMVCLNDPDNCNINHMRTYFMPIITYPRFKTPNTGGINFG